MDSYQLTIQGRGGAAVGKFAADEAVSALLFEGVDIEKVIVSHNGAVVESMSPLLMNLCLLDEIDEDPEQ